MSGLLVLITIRFAGHGARDSEVPWIVVCIPGAYTFSQRYLVWARRERGSGSASARCPRDAVAVAGPRLGVSGRQSERKEGHR